MLDLKKADCLLMDQQDDLTSFREKFFLPQGVIYLDGNSLGVLLRETKQRVADTLLQEWGRGLIRSWNSAGWIDLPQRLGNKLAPLIGAQKGEVIIADSTSVNLFKVLIAALRLKKDRRVVLSEEENFPTDLYISEGALQLMRNFERRFIPARGENWGAFLDDSVAVVMLTHVNFKTGRMHDMKHITRLAHEKGALIIWDLSHSAGAIPLDLNECAVDFAVGCTYKYLNGGPGAPAFLYVKESLQQKARQPLTGWMGHANPFDFSREYQAAVDISQFLCGTPAILSMAAIEPSLDLFAQVDMQKIRGKSQQLSELFIELMSQECGEFGFELVSPIDANQRGSQVSYVHPEAFSIMQSLIAHQVIGDFRTPDILRFGMTPLYLRFVDIWDAIACLKTIMENEEWDQPQFKIRGIVT